MTKKKLITHPRQSRFSLQSLGFTLIETMVAGIIMSIILVAVARLSISAIATSSHQTIRRKIEAAISNDIQLLQQADSRLKFIEIVNKDKACEDPGLFLKEQLSNNDSGYYVKEPLVTGLSGERLLKRTMSSTKMPMITKITYTIYAPEKNIKKETRLLKLYPNFHHLCDAL